MGRPLYAQRIGVLVQGLDHAVGQRAYGFAVFDGAFDDLVVNVRDIAHVGDLQATCFQPALDHVKRHHGARVTQVAQVVNRHAAYIHADLAWNQGRKIFYFTRQRVVYPEAHELSGCVVCLKAVKRGWKSAVSMAWACRKQVLKGVVQKRAVQRGAGNHG